MRAFELLYEKAVDDLGPLKTKVISSIKTTSDADLLNKIYSSLNSTNITGRIASALARDEDVKKYLDGIVDIIVNIPASYEEKISFADGLGIGYVDIKKMLSGNRVNFDELLVTNKDGPSVNFLKQVFKNLKELGAKAGKGPGEFSLAVLSPKLTIFGSGDIKIGKLTIEVKASAGKTESSGGGRIGTTGFLQHQNIPAIIAKYIPSLDTTKDLNLTNFGKIGKNLDINIKTALATDVFAYIFAGQSFVDIKPLVQAYVSGEGLSKAFLNASYKAYQGDVDNKKFDGIMLVNFSLEELKYYEDPDEMFDEIYAVNPLLISANKQYAGRSILPTTTLRAEPVAKVDLPVKGTALTPDVKKLLTQYAEMMLKSVRIRDPQLQQQVTTYITNLWKTGVQAPTTFKKKILTQFPQLRRRA
jgi:hypothetical protein